MRSFVANSGYTAITRFLDIIFQIWEVIFQIWDYNNKSQNAKKFTWYADIEF